MAHQRILQTNELLKLGVFENTGQQDQEGKNIIRASFATLSGKITVKNEILNHLDGQIKLLLEAAGAAAKAALPSQKKEIEAKIEVLKVMMLQIQNHYREIDIEFHQRVLEIDNKIQEKVIAHVNGKYKH